jgi:DNA anti-recombination protein RmuC
MEYCAQLQTDFDKFREDFDLVGKHLQNAQSKYGSAEKRLDRFETKLERAAEQEAELTPGEPSPPALPRIVDAA